MAAPSKGKVRPWRSLGALLIIVVGLAVWTFWPGQQHTPKLGLDLQGGTQVILVPKPANGQGAITKDQLDQTVSIIRQRVNGFGVSEADVTTQGSGGSAAIVVAVPGANQERIQQLLSQTALLDFRAVESETAGAPQPEPTVAPGPATPAPKTKGTGAKGQSAPLAQPAATAKPKPAATPAPTAAPVAKSPPIESPTNSAALQKAYAELDCSKPENHQGGTPDNPAMWIVTCSKDGAAKYLLQPAFIKGTNVTDANATLPQNGAGGWQIDLTFDSTGAKQLADVSTKLSALQPPQNQFAIVLDGLVQSSPYFKEPILGGSATISGTFTAQEAKDQAQILKYGALPVNLTIAEVTSVSPTLGSDQLTAGLLAGGLGLLLVVVYLLIYYRALGLVAVASLLVAAGITYEIFVLLGRTLGLALTLAGVAGAIVAIGITADSFVVYFERIRDEVREGRSLRVACETGWSRARNTILAADFVSLLAAAILYFISVGNVRGFAFVLGVTTIIDIVVAFMFTRPVVTLLARTRWFTSGAPMSGLDPRRLGVAHLHQPAEPGKSKKRKEKVAVGAGATPAEEVADAVQEDIDEAEGVSEDDSDAAIEPKESDKPEGSS